MKVLKKNSKLVLLTSNFPFGFNETFLETEITYLAQSFSNITIVSFDIYSNKSRAIPKNTSIIRLRYELTLFEKISSIKYIFSREIFDELIHIRKQYKKPISFGIIKTILISFFNAKRIARKMDYLGLLNDYTVYYSYWTNDCALSLAILKHKKAIFKAISRAHGWDIFFGPSKYQYLPFRDYIVTNLNLLFTISEAGKSFVKEGWKAELYYKTQTSRLGVSRQEFQEPERGHFQLISCSNIIALKRVHLIVESLAQLNFKVDWIHFGDGNLMELVIGKCAEVLPENITYSFKGRVDNSIIFNYYYSEKPNLFINLSSSEGIPVSIMEAMSFGIPVIATNVGGTSEIVNNENGYLLGANPTASDVAHKIKEFFNLTTDERYSKRKAAYETCKKKFDAENNYSQFTEDVISL